MDELFIRAAVHHDHLVEPVYERVRRDGLTGRDGPGALVRHVLQEHDGVVGEVQHLPGGRRLLWRHLVLAEQRGGGPRDALAARLREGCPRDSFLHAVEDDELGDVVARHGRTGRDGANWRGRSKGHPRGRGVATPGGAPRDDPGPERDAGREREG